MAAKELGMSTKMMEKRKKEAYELAEVTKEITMEEAKRLPNLFGIIAQKQLEIFGYYGYKSNEQGLRTLLILKN